MDFHEISCAFVFQFFLMFKIIRKEGFVLKFLNFVISWFIWIIFLHKTHQVISLLWSTRLRDIWISTVNCVIFFSKEQSTGTVPPSLKRFSFFSSCAFADIVSHSWGVITVPYHWRMFLFYQQWAPTLFSLTAPHQTSCGSLIRDNQATCTDTQNTALCDSHAVIGYQTLKQILRHKSSLL